MRVLVVAALLFAAAFSAFANGGGYYPASSTTGSLTGFSPSGTEEIRVLDEQLTIKLRPFEVDVDVRYIMKNGERPVTARFGFPIEELPGGNGMIVDDAAAPETWDKPKYCRDYSIEVSGKPVSAKLELENDSSKKADVRRAGLKGWLVSKVSFAAGEEKIIRIRYRSDYPYSTYGVSDNESQTSKEFLYRLSTGACWDGPIEKGRVVVEADGVDSRDVSIIRPVNRFKKEGGKWVWNFDKLEPTLDDDLRIWADPGAVVDMRGNEKYLDRKGIWYHSHANYEVKASSTLPPSDGKRYDPGGLRDVPDKLAWSEGSAGPGINEWIEITPEVAQPLRALEIRPGYASDEKLFLANARPKTVEVLLNDSHRFDATLADRRATQRIPIEGFEKPIKKIRVTVKEVYRGDQFEDMCISSIRLEAKLKKQPKVEPVR